jgi:signal transduction histidine kinase
MPRRFVTSNEDRVVAGVCAGIAQTFAVDVTLVRLVFALLALAGGAGIVLYLALWAFASAKHPWWAWLLVLLAGSLLLHALGLSDRAVAGLALVAGGLVLAWRRRRNVAGVVVAAIGVTIILEGGGARTSVLAPGAVAGALLLVGGPWAWKLAVERDAERAARIRLDERSEVAARVHDSVLQTLALIQRHAQEPKRVASLARRQERELRGWLYGDRALGSLVAALSAAAADVEELHGVRVELSNAGDCPAPEALVLAAREAMTNAAKLAGVDEIDVYAEVTDDAVSVFVHDRGRGFARADVPSDRKGLKESIEGRLERAGGTATVTSTPGAGTEVELRLPR